MRDYRYENGTKVLYRLTERRYDGFGSMISEAEVECNGSDPTATEIAAMRIAYTYDNNGKMISTGYPSAFGSSVSGLEYEYGDYSRLMKIKAVTAEGTPDVREYAYDVKGNVSSIRDDRTALGGEGYTLKAYGYDHFLRPASITVTDSEKEDTAEEYTYAYDKNGQIVTETKLNNYPSPDNRKAFSLYFQIEKNTWPTVLLVKPVHTKITRRYREAWKYFYGTKKARESYYRKVTKAKMINIVQKVYVDMPSLLLIAVQQVKKDYWNKL